MKAIPSRLLVAIIAQTFLNLDLKAAEGRFSKNAMTVSLDLEVGSFSANCYQHTLDIMLHARDDNKVSIYMRRRWAYNNHNIPEFTSWERLDGTLWVSILQHVIDMYDDRLIGIASPWYTTGPLPSEII